MKDIRFETINGTLCRMVEPEPLTPEANFPCVVRFISSNDRLGEYVASAYSQRIRQAPNYCIGIDDYNIAIFDHDSDIGAVLDYKYYYLLEIIGYPVEEGSAEWALYQDDLEKLRNDNLQLIEQIGGGE